MEKEHLIIIITSKSDILEASHNVSMYNNRNLFSFFFHRSFVQGLKKYGAASAIWSEILKRQRHEACFSFSNTFYVNRVININSHVGFSFTNAVSHVLPAFPID